jgi:signal transduction histidine kinase
MRSSVLSLNEVVEQLLVDVERIITELRPMLLDSLGCVAAAEWQVSSFATRTGIKARFCSEVNVPVPNDIGTMLFRVLQEGLTNVARHAEASCVSVDLSLDRGVLVLNIADDGIGISESNCDRPDAFGVRGMTERLRALDGALSIVPSGSGRGTRLTARVPLRMPCDGV